MADQPGQKVSCAVRVTENREVAAISAQGPETRAGGETAGEGGDGWAYIRGRSGQRNATDLSGGFNGDCGQSRGSLYQIMAALSRA